MPFKHPISSFLARDDFLLGLFEISFGWYELSCKFHFEDELCIGDNDGVFGIESTFKYLECKMYDTFKSPSKSKLIDFKLELLRLATILPSLY